MDEIYKSHAFNCPLMALLLLGIFKKNCGRLIAVLSGNFTQRRGVRKEIVTRIHNCIFISLRFVSRSFSEGWPLRANLTGDFHAKTRGTQRNSYENP